MKIMRQRYNEEFDGKQKTTGKFSSCYLGLPWDRLDARRHRGRSYGSRCRKDATRRVRPFSGCFGRRVKPTPLVDVPRRSSHFYGVQPVAFHVAIIVVALAKPGDSRGAPPRPRRCTLADRRTACMYVHARVYKVRSDCASLEHGEEDISFDFDRRDAVTPENRIAGL